MRPIKFRQAIYIKDKFHHWHYWGFLPDLSFSGPDSINGLAHALDNSQQFTGLFDKSDKEIYEGDLVQEYFSSLKHKGRIQQVVWIQEDCCFGLKPSNPYDYTPLQYSDNREIIGDIRTTPKLLEKPK